MTRDHDVVRVGLRHPGGDGAHSALRNQLDADGGARIHALQVEDQLSQIFNGIDVMVRRRADKRNAGLRMAQTGDQLRNLVAGKLAAFAGLRSLGDLDLDLLGVGQIFGGDSKARGGHLLHLVIKDRGSTGIGRVCSRIFSALAGIGAAAELVHGLGDGLVRFRAQRAQRHRGSDEAAARWWGTVSTWSRVSGAAAGRISNRSRSTVGLFSTAWVLKAVQAWPG